VEKKMKHLDFLQFVIARMNANSFLLKGWAVTLVVALFALDISKTSVSFIKVSFLPAILFWILDGYFLYQERLFRDLYDNVRMKDESQINFSMKRSSNAWKFFDAVFSKTLSLFYGVLIITTAYILFKGGF
jgi:hypothetical protein